MGDTARYGINAQTSIAVPGITALSPDQALAPDTAFSSDWA